MSLYSKKKIVILGGGTGTSVVLHGLKYFPVEITAVITVSDNGRSTGKLREEFSMPAMGDVRQVLTNLSMLPDDVKSVMEHRFITSSDLGGHPMGNLLLTALYQKTGSLKTSIEHMSALMKVEHRVLPLSEDNLTLRGFAFDGEVVDGESEVSSKNKHYRRISYKEQPHVIPEVIDAVLDADLVLLSTGSLYTSVLPHLACKEVREAIRKSPAKVMYICNAMTQPGETDSFTASDHMKVLESYLGKKTLDAVVVSDNELPKNLLEKYAEEEGKEQVHIDTEELKTAPYEVLRAGLLTAVDGAIRHDSLKLSSIIFHYLMR